MKAATKTNAIIGLLSATAFGLIPISAFSASPAATQAPAMELSSGFQTPSGNIHCMIENADADFKYPVTLRCDIGRLDNGLPPRPRWCEFDWGQTFAVAANGAAGQRLCASDSAIDDKRQVLPYGFVWQQNGFTCRSENTGLTCFNSKQHGFTLSRAVQRMF